MLLTSMPAFAAAFKMARLGWFNSEASGPATWP